MTTSSPVQFYSVNNYTPQASVAYLMIRNKSIYQRVADMKLAHLGITSSQMGVLMMIAHNENATISLISQLLGSDAAAIVRIVHKLEDQLLIQKVSSKTDRRVTHLLLTAEGKRLMKQVPIILSELLNHSLAGFTVQEFEQFKDFLSRVEKNNLHQLKDAL
jgi:DNA-binding MarR family transcriptional regulator